MFFSFEINNRSYKIDLEDPIDISIPLDFGGAQPNVYGVERAASKPCEAGSLVGDTRRGGSCNFEQITFIPHCNGTHTECVGHITRRRISVHDCLKDAFIPAALVSVEPENAAETDETYAIELDKDDKLITRKRLEEALENIENIEDPRSQIPDPKSLIVRTLPNDDGKKTRVYADDFPPPPFFSTEAMRFIVGKGIKHLLVDMPSIDRTFDGGRLSNHRIFWNVEQGSFEAGEKSFYGHTITELIYAPDRAAPDGTYLLNLQIAAFAADAAPSRPVLFKIFQ